MTSAALVEFHLSAGGFIHTFVPPHCSLLGTFSSSLAYRQSVLAGRASSLHLPLWVKMNHFMSIDMTPLRRFGCSRLPSAYQDS